MSLYALVLGDGNQYDRGALLCGRILGLNEEHIGRYRDSWVEKHPDTGAPQIAVYTRNGGGNRQDYTEQIDGMRDHDCYLSDRDDAFDSTYATFYFSLPADLEPDLVAAMTEVASEHVDTDARWRSVLDEMESKA